MSAGKIDITSRGWRAVVWTLRATVRATVALQCVGHAWWFLRVEESSLLSFLWGAPDIGGLGFSETAALDVIHTVGWCALLASALVLLRPCGWVLLPLAMLQLAIALATVRMGAEFQIDWPMLPPWVAMWFPLLSHAARIAAPLGLWLLDPWTGQAKFAAGRIETGIAILRFAIVVTFLAHGIEAAMHFPKFVDFNILATRQAFGWDMTQAVSEAALTVIAALDIMVAVVVAATRRLRMALYYMAFWGFVTAASRILVQGWDHGTYEFATRAPHFGIPLTIALYWWMMKNGESHLSLDE